jgi:hypothetical protein
VTKDTDDSEVDYAIVQLTSEFLPASSSDFVEKTRELRSPIGSGQGIPVAAQAVIRVRYLFKMYRLDRIAFYSCISIPFICFPSRAGI